MKTSLFLSLSFSEHQASKQGPAHLAIKLSLRFLNHLLLLMVGWGACMTGQIQAQDNFTYINSQSALRVSLSVPSGASNLQPSWPAEVVATVVNESWDT
ncbi:MAG: hypothetical protein NTV80_02915 [Verrucomicrobia bacterium]|nr:hypothetical protein [Verrucomicrobiota bacterium]